MTQFSSPLDKVRIAAPCKADWEDMMGTDRVRFCGQCNLNVYNLSSLTRHEADSFIARNEGRLCVRFYRRSDGSILTSNCPVGLRALRRRISYLVKSVTSAVVTFFATVGLYGTFTDVKEQHVMGVMVEQVDIAKEQHVMGMVAEQVDIVGEINEPRGALEPVNEFTVGKVRTEGSGLSSQRSGSRRKKGHASYR